GRGASLIDHTSSVATATRDRTRGLSGGQRPPPRIRLFLAAPPRKEDPGQKGQGLIAGWVRGWGLGGTPPGAVGSTPRSCPGFLCAKLFSVRLGGAASVSDARRRLGV